MLQAQINSDNFSAPDQLDLVNDARTEIVQLKQEQNIYVKGQIYTGKLYCATKTQIRNIQEKYENVSVESCGLQTRQTHTASLKRDRKRNRFTRRLVGATTLNVCFEFTAHRQPPSSVVLPNSPLDYRLQLSS